MKIAVTGTTGFVGRAVVSMLAERGHACLHLNRKSTGAPDEIVLGDLQTAAIDTARLSRVDAVIHLVARTHSRRASDDSLDDYRVTNVAGTGVLLDAAIAAGVKRFVFVSSIKAVAERSQGGRPIDSSTVPAPEDAYGVTKLEAEQLVRERCTATGIQWVIVRPPLLYGPGAKGNFVRLVKLVAKGIPVPLGSVVNKRSILSVQNLADALIAACAAPAAAGQVLTLCDKTLSTPDLIRAIARVNGRVARLVPVPPAILLGIGSLLNMRPEIERLCGSLELDPASSMKYLGWSPPQAFEEALAEAVAAASNS